MTHAVPYTRIVTLVIDRKGPAFSSPLHVGRPWTGSEDRFRAMLDEIFKEARFTNDGPHVRRFEEQIAALHGVRHCIAVTNATLGLQIALKAVDATGEVLMPSFTFIGTAQAASWIGLKPVFCDINPLTLTLDPADAERRMGPDVSCILPVNLFGHPCDFEAIDALAKRHDLPVVYDSAHCAGLGAESTRIAGQGTLHVLSFHATKLLHTFEGGAILTNDDALAKKARLLRNYGFSGYDAVDCIGTNAKMSEIAAAYGLASLGDLETMIDVQATHHASYVRALAAVPGISFVHSSSRSRANHHYVVLLVDEDMFGMHRDTLSALLWAENVRARNYFSPGCHRMTPYRLSSETQKLSLPVTERIAGQTLCLPNDASLDESIILKICALIAEAQERASDVKEWHGALPAA
jgi:dTDP-4-amino-4,6-dideoxygalactose transaminase